MSIASLSIASLKVLCVFVAGVLCSDLNIALLNIALCENLRQDSIEQPRNLLNRTSQDPKAMLHPTPFPSHPTPLQASAAQASAAYTSTSQVVAEVNSKKILKNDIEQATNREFQFRFGASPPERSNNSQKFILEQIIERELLLQAAIKNSSLPEDSAVDKLLQDLHDSSLPGDYLVENIKPKYLSDEEFRRGVREDLAIRSYIEQQVYLPLDPKDGELKEFYQQNPHLFRIPEEVHARHILLKLPADASADDRQATQKKAEEIVSQFQSGTMTFEQLAKKYSDSPNRARGGDLGFFTKNQLEESFSEAAFALPRGNISDIVETSVGLHLIQVVDKRGGNVPPFENIQTQVKNVWEKYSRQTALRSHLKTLREKAKVIIYIN